MRILASLLLIVLFASNGLSQDIKQYPVDDLQNHLNSTEDVYAVISPTSHEKNYFSDEQDGFLIQFSQLDASNPVPDSFRITVDSITRLISGVDPIVITGLKDGEHSFKFAANGDLPFTGSQKIGFVLSDTRPVFENDAVVFGILMLILAFVFWTANMKGLKGFYKYVPALLLCYFIPAIFNSIDIVNSHVSGLYGMAKNYLLPGALVLLCLSIDLKGILKLGPKALAMFFTATLGILLGGPLALWIYSSMDPSVFVAPEGEEVYRGLATVAGSWIGGGANQTAMKEIAGCGDVIFSQMIIVDVFIANVFMALILFGVGKKKKLDRWFKANSKPIDELQDKMANYSASVSKVPTFKDVILMLGVVFACVGGAHALGKVFGNALDPIVSDNQYLSFLSSKFFWLVVLATLFGVCLSFTKAKKMEGVGASRVGSVFIYVLVATIGMKMDIPMLIDNWATFKALIIIGLIWIAFHGILLLIVAKLIKAPYFFAAVGSQANVGGAASAPVVAGSFHPSLAPVGVLLAVLGYAVGTIAAIICYKMMEAISISGAA